MRIAFPFTSHYETSIRRAPSRRRRVNPKPCAVAPHCVARARETHAMSYYGDDAKTDATETRRRKLQQWDTTLDAYAFDKRNDLRATDGRVTNRCARL